MTNPVFPEGLGDGMEPFRLISERWTVDLSVVEEAFRCAWEVEYSAPGHLNDVADNVAILNRSAIYAEALIKSLRMLPEDSMARLRHAGCVTLEQLQHLLSELSDDESYLVEWSDQPNNSRRGGRNPSAYLVAKAMRRLFRKMRKPITYGLSTSGTPTTDFCKGVEHALSAFRIRANWRGPAREEWERHIAIGNRQRRCAEAKFKRSLGDTNS